MQFSRSIFIQSCIKILLEKLILEELLRDEALEAFKIWYQKEDKVPY